MIIEKPNFHVFTGGPGVGKTTLLRHLETMGELTVPENARAVIQDESARGGRGAPWRDNDRFLALTHARDIADFDRLETETRRVFFDRGIMDMYGANGATPSAEVIEAVRTRRYNRHVFVFPPWREIYATDNERKQDWVEAERTFDVILNLLSRLDYAPVVVPIGSIEDRAAFVLNRTV